MVRSIALMAVLGALIAAGGDYAITQTGWRDIVAMWIEGSPRGRETAVATENWPICTTMAALGAADVEGLDPDFAAGKKALVAGNWNTAIISLELAALRDPRNADIQNYIGYAYRRLRELGPAMQHYQQALTFNRRHRGAHEHLGELYLVLGDAGKAAEHLAMLEDICLIPCEEYGDLQRAIATYRSSSR